MESLCCPYCNTDINKQNQLRYLLGSKQKRSNRYVYCPRGCFTILKYIAGRSLEEKEIRMLIEKGETEVMEFKSSSGKNFKAKLMLNREKKMPVFSI